MVLGIFFSARRAVFARGGSPLVHAPKAGALPTALHPDCKYKIIKFKGCIKCSPVATKALSARARLACQSPSCCHSLFLVESATGGTRKRPQLRYIPISFFEKTKDTRCVSFVLAEKERFELSNPSLGYTISSRAR